MRDIGTTVRYAAKCPGCSLKVHMVFRESYLPSLATSCENMASHRERIMEKNTKVSNSLCGPYKPLALSTLHN